MPVAFYVILLLIIIAGILGIIYTNIYNNIQNQIIRINEAEHIIDETLRKRFDLITSARKFIRAITKDDFKEFVELDEVKSNSISNFDFDRITLKCLNLIYQINSDYFDNKKENQLLPIILELRETEEKLDAAKTYYNNHTKTLNKYIKKFPSLLVARIHNIRERNYFDNKNLNDDIEDDFKF